MPARRPAAQPVQPTENTTEKEIAVTEKTTDMNGTDPRAEGGRVIVNVAIAVWINPDNWSLAEQSPRDRLVAKIVAEKNVSQPKAEELADLMIENGLADMVAPSSSSGVNDVRREIREYVRDQVAMMPAFTAAGAFVELNEARRTNHRQDR